MGIVLVYRSTRVINFAVGNMGLVGASLLALLVVDYGVPFWLAAVVALVVGHALRRDHGAGRRAAPVQRAARHRAGRHHRDRPARRWRSWPRYPEIDDLGAPYPVPSDTTWNDVAGHPQVTGAQLAVLVVVPVVAVALGWFLNRTLLGRTVKASAENPDLARVQGINPKIVSTAVWAIAGFVATLTMILIAGDNAGRRSDVTTLGPNTLVRALAAAVIAGMVSFPRAMLAGVAIGVVAGVHPVQLPRQARADRRAAVRRGAGRGGLPEPRPRRRRRRRPSRSPRRSARSPSSCATSGGCAGSTCWSSALVRRSLAIAVPLVITAPSRQLLYATIAASRSARCRSRC